MLDANEAVPSTSQFFSERTPADQSLENSISVTSKISDFIKGLDCDQLEVFFRVVETVKWINDNNYKRVALQLPDHFLAKAFCLAKLIESKVDGKTFILADTSYRSCCVDEIAAAHAFCDAIVHYGDACLSALTENIPVKFVFGSFPVDLEAFSHFSNFLTPDDAALLFLTDACYSEKSDVLFDIVRCVLPKGRQLYHAKIMDPSQRDFHIGNGVTYTLGRLVPGEFCNASSAQVCFVGDPSSPLVPLWLMTFPQCSSVISFDPQSSLWAEHTPQSWRELRKRLFLIEKLRDARTVGLVVGSVGVKGHAEAVRRVREMCLAAGKRLYVISVGKVNVPKLSNFVDIDVFVLLSCPFGVILDSSEFFRPVLSMFEAEVALNPLKKWSGAGKWCADFSEFLNDTIGAHEGDDADLSLITGKMRSSHLQNCETSSQSGQVVLYHAGDYFKNHSWHGLDDSVHLNESTQVEEGRTGIARGYNIEPGNLL